MKAKFTKYFLVILLIILAFGCKTGSEQVTEETSEETQTAVVSTNSGEDFPENIEIANSIREELNAGILNASIIVENFDTGFPADDLAARWWTYSDNLGSEYECILDKENYYSGDTSLCMKYLIVPNNPSQYSIGHAGIGHDFTEAQNYEGTKGVLLKLKSTEPGLKVYLTVYMRDMLQTSPLSSGRTPFEYKFFTPAGSEEDWVDVIIPWDGFVRSTWIGKEGAEKLEKTALVILEIALENHDLEESQEGTIWVDDISIIN